MYLHSGERNEGNVSAGKSRSSDASSLGRKRKSGEGDKSSLSHLLNTKKFKSNPNPQKREWFQLSFLLCFSLSPYVVLMLKDYCLLHNKYITLRGLFVVKCPPIEQKNSELRSCANSLLMIFCTSLLLMKFCTSSL